MPRLRNHHQSQSPTVAISKVSRLPASPAGGQPSAARPLMNVAFPRSDITMAAARSSVAKKCPGWLRFLVVVYAADIAVALVLWFAVHGWRVDAADLVSPRLLDFKTDVVELVLLTVRARGEHRPAYIYWCIAFIHLHWHCVWCSCRSFRGWLYQPRDPVYFFL